MGLSPRVRGNRDVEHEKPIIDGVYPRVCGGTVALTVTDLDTGGLSPRVRGNPLLPSSLVTQIRSIPACAGEPAAAEFFGDPDTVYPRVCGGTRQCPV